MFMLHGGDIYTDGILKGRKLLDFSSNINPLGIPIAFKENIEEAIKNAERYPDINYRELASNLSKYTGVKEECFVFGNGAAEIIDLAISCFESILIVVPSFIEYELNAIKWGAKIEYSYLTENANFNYDDIQKKLKSVEALIIANPNNPNGSVIDKSKFRKILEFCERENKFIIIDEAFIEFTGDKVYSFVNEILDFKCLIIIRALTKFFAMPGIRFGYGISANEGILKKIRGKQNPWNINCFAELAVKYVLNDKLYIEKSKEWIMEERNRFSSQLKNIKFIDKVFDTKSNFLLCKLKYINDDKLHKLCLENGIVIRKARGFRGLDESFIRLAIKDIDSNERLIKVLKKIENLNVFGEGN